ncbi:MAG: MFS transporter, partial [Desulfobacterales bacterium]
AIACLRAGILAVAFCGVAYLLADRFWTLAMVRIAHGAGIFLVMASCMVILVAIMPPKKTGMAFSLYSVAMLAPYSIMPAVSEMLLPMTDSPTRIYLATAGLLLPALGILPTIRRRVHGRLPLSDLNREDALERGAETKNLFRQPVISILLVNSIYFTLFSALFFLFEGFGIKRGVKNPGFFFTLQMGVMIAIRLFGGRLFDTVSKVALVAVAFLLTGIGFLLLQLTPDPAWILPIAVVFGTGMGLSVPPLNSLMYLVTHPRYRGYNANMMMLSVHLGSFLGPFVGAWMIEAGGYDLFLTAAFLLTGIAAGFFVVANPAKGIQTA